MGTLSNSLNVWMQIDRNLYFFHHGSSLLIIDDSVIIAAYGCHQGADLYARPGDGPWRFQAGMYLNPVFFSFTSSRCSQSNIMVDDAGRAVLAGFCLTPLILDQLTFISSLEKGDEIRWTSPEFYHPEKFGFPTRDPTRESDCYALGMVVYEILSGCRPFGADNSFDILRKVLEGERPERPQGEAGNRFNNDIWDVVERCWRTEPKERASARDVLLCLKGDSRTVDGGDDRSDYVPIGSQNEELDAAGSNSSKYPSFHICCL